MTSPKMEMKGILFVLEEKINCHEITELSDIITVRKTEFKEYDSNDYSGFYDWLRDRSGRIMGLRYYRFDGFEPDLLDWLNRLSYTESDRDKVITIYFHAEKDFEENISNDQDLGVCKVYISSGVFALLLDTMYLTDKELLSILLSNRKI